VAYWSAVNGVPATAFDPSGLMTSMAKTRALSDVSSVFPLTTAGKPGILMPHYLELDPKRTDFEDDEDWADAMRGAAGARVDRAIDATLMCLPWRMVRDSPYVSQLVESACASVGGQYGTHSREIIDAVRREGERGAEIAAMLEARARMPDGSMIFPERDEDDEILNRLGRDSLFTLVTMPGLSLPTTADRDLWTREEHRAILIASLGWRLAVRNAWANRSMKTVWVDEMGILMGGFSSVQSDIVRLAYDTRKYSISAGFAAQTGGPIQAIDPDIAGIAGTTFLGRSRGDVSSSLRLLGVEAGHGWEESEASLPDSEDAREFIVSGWDGRVRRVAVDRAWWDVDLAERLNTTPRVPVAPVSVGRLRMDRVLA